MNRDFYEPRVTANVVCSIGKARGLLRSRQPSAIALRVTFLDSRLTLRLFIPVLSEVRVEKAVSIRHSAPWFRLQLRPGKAYGVGGGDSKGHTAEMRK